MALVKIQFRCIVLLTSQHSSSRLRPFTMTSLNGNIFRVTGPLCGQFTGHRCIPHTNASDAVLWCFFFDLRMNKRLSKQSWGWRFETPASSLWRHRNVDETKGWLEFPESHDAYTNGLACASVMWFRAFQVRFGFAKDLTWNGDIVFQLSAYSRIPSVNGQIVMC